MRVLISGASGLIGQSVSERLRHGGHEVVRLVRREPRSADEVRWDPAGGILQAGALEGVDAVLHLAGESIAGGRWTKAKKDRIRDSRVQGTTLLAERLAEAPGGPRVFVSASAIGYYGDRGDDWAREPDPPGDLFISDVCVDWEGAAEPARQAGLRVVHPRIGVVLSAEGGALGQMLLPFKLGVGGKVGSGRQFMSWISLEDVVAILVFCVENEAASGPVNAVAPAPARNADSRRRSVGRCRGRRCCPCPRSASRRSLADGPRAPADEHPRQRGEDPEPGLRVRSPRARPGARRGPRLTRGRSVGGG